MSPKRGESKRIYVADRAITVPEKLLTNERICSFYASGCLGLECFSYILTVYLPTGKSSLLQRAMQPPKQEKESVADTGKLLWHGSCS